MSYIGRWKFDSIGTIDDERGLVYLNAEEYLKAPMPYIDENDEEAVADELKERKMMISMQIEIAADGKLYYLSPLPEGVTDEEVKAAVEAGEITLYDGMTTQSPTAWEDRDGEFWYDTGIEGEFFGEKTDSWAKAIDENGYFNFMNIRFVKTDK
ncbi:MAG: hypothetical protein IJB65_07070 [Clostridia bacterium]|nr:hypothetical protein [Clostridia bacterium]